VKYDWSEDINHWQLYEIFVELREWAETTISNMIGGVCVIQDQLEESLWGMGTSKDRVKLAMFDTMASLL